MTSRWRDDNGTVTMEFVLVMPILVFLIFGIIQLSLVCLARQLTHYAAYSAARTAIVHHPDDFSDNGKFHADRGVVHEAACMVLAWLGQLPGGPDRLRIPGWGEIPGSGYIRQQVSIDASRSALLTDVRGVKVTVQFRYPLLIPFAGQLIAYFAGGGSSDWTFAGLVPSDMASVIGGRKIGGVPYILLYDSCVLTCPWDTSVFPRAATGGQS